MSEFFYMGGYAAYVWSSFGLTVLILAFNAIQPIIRRKQIRREVLGQLKREQNNSASQTSSS